LKKISSAVVLLLVILLVFAFLGGEEGAAREEAPLGMAVEFMDHAACAYVSQDQGWFKEEGLELTSYESYVTGMALAAALARGDIQVAYICLAPAISAYVNAQVPIKIVAGTHKYGYGLVVNPAKVKTVQDLEKPEIRLGCVREGGPVDLLLRKTIDKYNLNESQVLKQVYRMDPPKQVLALRTGQLDAAFLPEQWATMAEEHGFKMLLTSQEIWPEMQGSVLVVKQELIRGHPEVVKKLVKITQRATDWINQYPEEAAEVVARQLQALQAAGGTLFPVEAAETASQLEITPEVLFKSMNRLEYTMDIDPQMVQETIDYMAHLGYIKNSFKAQDILDLSFREE